MSLKTIEEISLKMTPSFKDITYDGWVLKFFKKYFHKTNSIYPLNYGKININKKIDECENLYLKMGFSYAYRITPFSQPQNLDNKLNDKGFKKKFITRMLFLNLNDILLNSNKFSDITTDFDEWSQAYKFIGNFSDIESIIHEDFHKFLSQKKCLMLIKNKKKYISCGMGIINNDYFGIFDVKTNKDYQQKGYATELIKTMLLWAKQNKAKYVYLNVDHSNIPACNLYYKIGFKEIYKYWFRIDKRFL